MNEQVKAASAGALTELETNKAVLEETGKMLEETGAELDEYEKEMNKAKRELDDAKKKLDDAQAEIDDANAEIDDAMQEVEDALADAKLYVWNRDEFNPGCMAYGTDAERVDSIAAVFPIFFIVVAALVCCTTMSRMVEADRTEAGTMKALGFSSREIIMQYVLYAACAGFVGSVIGVIIGFPLLPNIIYKCYCTLYRYPFFEAKFMPDLAAVCIIASVLCTVLSTVYTAVKELRAVPAELIRPKPPKEGKRIFLENIGFIWKNMKFTSKVSFRNLFRYKSRLFMTVIGICGCTALLLTAFGLREAIACIVERQYNNISVYDAIAVISDKADEEETAEIYAAADSEPLIIDRMNAIQETYGASSAMSDKKTDCYVFSPEDSERFGDYIVLRDRKSGRHIELQDGKAVITEKLADMLGVSVGDEVYLGDDKAAVTISDITENYAFHYIYMNRSTHDEVLGGKEWNTILFQTDGTPQKEDRDRIASDLISCDGVVSASFMYDGADSFRKLVKSLNLIVVVLILFSGALAFVILFNLANININERIRE
ncbi:MAG: FtsX-like permease family protein, partial [Huintestinicola sp.]